MNPTTRAQLKDYCLRKLGAPVIEINVDDEQLEDRLDEAITRFQTFHYDGKEKAYTSHLITSGDIANTYIQMANDVIGVTRIFTLSGSYTNSSGSGGFNMFDINYQIRLNELYDFMSGDYVYFELANQHIRMLEMMFTGEIPIRYNKYTNVLHIDADWRLRFPAGNYILIEVYRALGAGVAFYGDDWLRKYTTALFKEQWGTNIKKFGSVSLPGGMILNGQQIYNEAVEEKEKLENQLRDEFEDPPEFLVG